MSPYDVGGNPYMGLFSQQAHPNYAAGLLAQQQAYYTITNTGYTIATAAAPVRDPLTGDVATEPDEFAWLRKRVTEFLWMAR